MMNIKYLLGIIFWIILNACTEKKAEDLHEFRKINTVRFPADSTINPYAINVEFFEVNKENKHLFILDGNNQLLKYDFNSKKLIQKVILEKEGNNGVGIANGFKLISEDSIIITSKFYQKIFLVDGNGKVIDSYSFKNDELYTSYACSNMQQQIIIQDDILVLPQNLVGNWNNISEEYYKNYTTTLDFNIKTGDVQKSGMKLPFKFPHLASPGFSVKPFQNKTIYSFFALDSLYVVYNNGVNAYYAKTMNIKKLVGKNRTNYSSVEDILRNKVVTGEYYMLMPDLYRNFIFRFYKLGLDEIPKDKNLMDLNAFPPVFGIQVINNKFEVISDVTFPESKYFFSNSFVAEDGLYISINHPDNPDFDVDYFSFERFIFIE